MKLSKNTDSNETLEAALKYAEEGWSVISLHGIRDGKCTCAAGAYCGSPGKHPRTRNGSKDATKDPEVIKRWWQDWPIANVGIATGSESGIAIVDADGEAGLTSLYNMELPPTLAVSTGSGGLHLYYGYIPGIKNSSKKIADGIDVRGDGGFVVAPPSLHITGNKYEWLNGDDLSPYPLPVDAVDDRYEVVDTPDAIPSGMRNDALLRLAGVLRRRGLNEDEIFAGLKAVNDRRCKPPLSEQEVRSIARSVTRYDPQEPLVARDHDQHIQVYTARELCAIDLPDKDELCGPLLVRGNRLVIAAGTGEGKTTLALQLVKASLAGEHFLRWRGVGGLQVLIIDAEQGLRTIQRRFLEASLHEQDSVHLIRVPDGLNLDEDYHAIMVEEVINDVKPDVVVLDPLYKLHKGEVTDERVAVELMRRLDAWRERYHFALVLLAHCRKPMPGAPFTIHDVFGSTAVSRGAEVVLGLQRTGPGTSHLSFFKDRDGDLPIGETWELLFDREQGFTSSLQLLWQDEGDNAETASNHYRNDSHTTGHQ